MATDITALADAIRSVQEAVAATEDMRRTYDDDEFLAAWYKSEALAGRALLAALEGVPERLAALEAVAVAAREIPITWRLDAVKAAVAALDGEGAG